MNPFRCRALILVVLFSIFGVCHVRADSFQSGQTFSVILPIAGKQVPLPEGEWLVAGYSQELVKSSIDFGPYGIIHDLILLRVDGDTVNAFIQVHANALPVNDGWGISRDCQRRDGYATAVRYQSGWDVSCVFLVHTNSPATNDSSRAWKDALVYANEKRMAIPPTWITTGFRQANRRDILDIRIAYNPQARGISDDPANSWADSLWHATRVQTDNIRSQFLRDLAMWTVGYAAMIEEGIKNRLQETQPYHMPFSERETGNMQSAIVTERLKVLDRLRAEGLVGQSVYEAQREHILSGRSQEPIPQPDASTIALWKTISYRPLVSFANAFIDYYWVGSPFAAGVLVALQIVVNTTKFYFHEIAWERFFGDTVGKRDAPRVVDFSYAGVSG